ncbi:MAG: Maf family protein [Gammaproteobacteria bacterium]
MRAPFAILLASGSTYRKALLKRLIDHFEVASADLDESPEGDESPERLAQRLARQKAEALSLSYPEHWIIASDQVAHRDGIRLEKPGNYARAFEQLSESSGKCVTFVTAVCLLGPGADPMRVETDLCRVYFRPLSATKIDRYLQREKPYDCAASFKSEASGIALVHRIEGRDPSALIGLPLTLLTEMMEEFGLEVL